MHAPQPARDLMNDLFDKRFGKRHFVYLDQIVGKVSGSHMLGHSVVIFSVFECFIELQNVRAFDLFQ